MTSKSELKRFASQDPVTAAERIYRMQDVIRERERELAAARAENERLRGRIAKMRQAMQDGYHSGFCNGTCAICDAYKASMTEPLPSQGSGQ